MSLIGSVGALMAGSGLKEILSSAFAGSDKMLQGKKFHMNLGTFTFVVTELLKGHVEEMDSYDEMECWSLSCVKQVPLQNIGLKTL